jgi:hypothetical protein
MAGDELVEPLLEMAQGWEALAERAEAPVSLERSFDPRTVLGWEAP